MKTLAILFGGSPAEAKFIDGTAINVFVRALPQRYLVHVLNCCEFKHALVELCCYIKNDPAAAADATPPAPRAIAPEVVPPAGYGFLPDGWTDNLTDESVEALYALAQELNFQRAAKWAQGQIAAKKLVAPLHEAAMTQVMPLVEKIMKPLMAKLDTLSTSTPSAPSSSDAAAKTS